MVYIFGIMSKMPSVGWIRGVASFYDVTMGFYDTRLTYI